MWGARGARGARRARGARGARGAVDNPTPSPNCPRAARRRARGAVEQIHQHHNLRRLAPQAGPPERRVFVSRVRAVVRDVDALGSMGQEVRVRQIDARERALHVVRRAHEDEARDGRREQREHRNEPTLTRRINLSMSWPTATGMQQSAVQSELQSSKQSKRPLDQRGRAAIMAASRPP